MTAPRAAVVGAGALGLLAARRLADDGWRVDLHETAARPSASAVAAGMLAPASEAVLDGAGPFALLRDARDLWSALAGDAAWLRREGALHLVAPGAGEARVRAFAALGAQAWPAPPAYGGEAVFTLEDWRLDPASASAWLAGELQRRGVRRHAHAPLTPRAATPEALGVDAVVLAAGWGAADWRQAAPEAVELTPIKGQLLRAPGVGPRTGPVLRTEAAYLAPGAEGLIVGATMETGIADTGVTEAAVRALRAAAAPYAPGLEHARVVASAGVRATTPDGLPLVGPSAAPGLWWAAGARRNGWLLAPLVAEVLAARLGGRDAGPWAARLEATRFGGSPGGGPGSQPPASPQAL